MIRTLYLPTRSPERRSRRFPGGLRRSLSSRALASMRSFRNAAACTSPGSLRETSRWCTLSVSRSANDRITIPSIPRGVQRHALWRMPARERWEREPRRDPRIATTEGGGPPHGLRTPRSQRAGHGPSCVDTVDPIKEPHQGATHRQRTLNCRAGASVHRRRPGQPLLRYLLPSPDDRTPTRRAPRKQLGGHWREWPARPTDRHPGREPTPRRTDQDGHVPAVRHAAARRHRSPRAAPRLTPTAAAMPSSSSAEAQPTVSTGCWHRPHPSEPGRNEVQSADDDDRR